MDNMTGFIATSIYPSETTTEMFSLLDNTTTASGASPIPRQILTFVPLSIYLFITAIVTFLVNSLVLITFITNKSLMRSNFNLFLLHLTLTDISVSVTGIPFYAVSYLLGTWPFGAFMCDVWEFCNWGLTFASVYILAGISVDRYWAVRWSHNYRANNTRRRIIIMLILIWVLVLLLWLPTYIDDRIESQRGHKTTKNGTEITCMWSVENNRNFGIVMAILGYHLPSFVIVFCYMRVFVIMRQSKLNLAKNNSSRRTNSEIDALGEKENLSKFNMKKDLEPEKDSTGPICDIETFIEAADPVVEKPTHDVEVHSQISDSRIQSVSDSSRQGNEMYTLNIKSSPSFTGSALGLDAPAVKGIGQEDRLRSRSYTDGASPAAALRKKTPATVKRLWCTSAPAGPVWESNILPTSANITQLKQKSLQQQDYKLFVRLSYIVLAYLICWLPFHVVFDIQLAGIPVNKHWYTFGTLMCYLNSAVNPVLYALGNPKLKEAFKQTLKCACCKRSEKANGLNNA